LLSPFLGPLIAQRVTAQSRRHGNVVFSGNQRSTDISWFLLIVMNDGIYISLFVGMFLSFGGFAMICLLLS
jgi:hypothetical protein